MHDASISPGFSRVEETVQQHVFGRLGLFTVWRLLVWPKPCSKSETRLRVRIIRCCTPTLELWVVFMSMIRITVVAAQTRATRPIRRRLRMAGGRIARLVKSDTLHVRVQNRWLEQGCRRRNPPVEFPTYDALKKHLASDATGTCLLQALRAELPIKPNPRGVPSLWYMPLVGGENFFDGFGFQRPAYQRRYGWKGTPIDERERRRPPARPLLLFLEQLNRRLPQKWDNKRKTYVRNDDWLLWNIQPNGMVEEPHRAKR
jgi:hypothetical protein